MLYRLTTATILSFWLLCFPSCNSLVEVRAPGNLFDADRIFSSKTGFEAVMAGIYQNMLVNNGMTNGGLSTYVSLAADDLTTRSTSVAYQGFLTNKILSDNSAISQFWQVSYRGVYRTNMVLERLQDADFLTGSERDNFTGQALFVRSFYYFYLTQLFGDVPLVLATDYQLSVSMDRTSSKLVWAQITRDLEHAIAYLSNASTDKQGIPNEFAARSLLARICMSEGNYEGVLQHTREILENGAFMLEANLDEVFRKSSREAIWQLAPETANVSDATSFVPASSSALPTFVLSTELQLAFEEGDLRKEKWVGKQTVQSIDYFYPYKYKVRTGTPPQEYNAVFRLAEILLLQAEAKAALKDFDGALDDLNKIRERAGLGSLSFSDEENLRAAIIHEKRMEFFAEWGHRWLDLKRWGIVDEVMGAQNAGWQPEAKLFPIPSGEIGVNPNLIQNPGYDN